MNCFSSSNNIYQDGKYIKKYIPELADVSPADLHKWHDASIRAKYKKYKNVQEYPAPVIDHEEASKNAVAQYKKAFEDWKASDEYKK